MTEINHKACGTEVKDTMSVRLPETTRLLKERQIRRIIGSYNARMIALVFVGPDDALIEGGLEGERFTEVIDVFRSMMNQRCADWPDGVRFRGTFDWDIPDDTLHHEPTLIYEGL